MTEVDRLIQEADSQIDYGVTEQPRGEPLWKGPEVDGITVSLLSKFLVCRERFRLLVAEGLKGKDKLNSKMEYGNLWHTAEEAHKRIHSPSRTDATRTWKEAITVHAKQLIARYPYDQQEIDKLYNCCLVQFPVYLYHWSKNSDRYARRNLLSENVFDTPYVLPSGRKVRLRGKWDAVDEIWEPSKGNKDSQIQLWENKTKSRIDEGQITRQLRFDVQTMTYLVALKEYQDHSFWNRSNKAWRNKPIAGVLYNVVRRPLSGGKGNIVQHKGSKNKLPETKEAYYQRVANYFKEEPSEYFMRWDVEVNQQDIDIYKRDFLTPCLEQLCLWYDVVVAKKVKEASVYNTSCLHYRMPYMTFNHITEGFVSEYDDYLHSGSMATMERTTNLFPELTGDVT